MKVLQLCPDLYWYSKNEYCFAIRDDISKKITGFISGDGVIKNAPERLDYDIIRSDARIIYESNSDSAVE